MATKENWEKGNEAELKFLRVAEELGWVVHQSSMDSDRFEHIDFIIEWGRPMDPEHPSATYSVDVKAKNTAEKGKETWIEMRNTQGQAGWLYGEADLIAFDQGDRFLLVDRLRLKEYIEENVDREYVTLAHQALYKVYTREGKKDMITLVDTLHLKGLAMGEMKYGV